MKNSVRVALLASLIVCIPLTLAAQQSQDDTARQVLQNAVSASLPSSSQIPDSVSTGSISYFWASQKVDGSVTISTKGTAKVSFATSLSDGSKRNWIVNNTAGVSKVSGQPDAKIQRSSALSLASFNIPAVKAVQVLQDTTMKISYMGVTTKNEHTFHRIRAQKTFGKDDAAATGNKNLLIDFLVDPQTLQILRIEVRFASPSTDQIPDEAYVFTYSDYRTQNGYLLPFQIQEDVNGQRVWTVQLDSVDCNQSVSDSIFTF